jgi:uncharacterized protein
MLASEKDEIRKDLADNSLVRTHNDDGYLLLKKDGYLLFEKEEHRIRSVQLKTIHQNEDGESIEFSLDEESEGTQRLIHLIPALFLLKQKNEKVILSMN